MIDLAVGRSPRDAVHTVLSGAPGAARDAVLANTAGALAAHNTTADLEDAFADGLDRAHVASDSGAAADLLARWTKLATALAPPR
ncbi:hypothetical protein MHW47_05135 [Streptomyces sp. OfavH-34-F]|uniref:hypothetical protein n=1 Tax=Streptomyces sp. OfavH-34-F TaxID=2917760 RepID=UPI001EF16AE2|nr:hypothetical protein [Streptomyces sp. OfavH-34-F]MCG7523832.1 hypothetical protein [Streptomyces sp. OfavH-34-F]